MEFRKIAEENLEYCIKLRREFHENPELSGEEIWTSNKIAKELENLGIHYIKVNKLNVIGIIDTKKEGKSIAIRADIDALPMTELNQVSYKSKNNGKMHACGHDAHISMLLTTAKSIVENIDKFKGKIYLCFQYGEEYSLGAKEIVDFLKKEAEIDHVFALHVMPTIETGKIFMKENGMWAGMVAWEINVFGKGGHGSKPHTAVDPIKPLCEIIQRISALAVNEINTFDPVVVSACTISAGTACNIIPESSNSTGTIRFFSMESFEKVTEKINLLTKNIAKSYGADATFTFSDEVTPPVINSVTANKIGEKSAKKCGLEVINGEPMMCSDNFSVFTQAFDGFYSILGVGNSEICTELHNPKFQINEEAMALGVEFFLTTAKEFLN